MLKEKENNMSTLTGQKSDGSSITFNFKLENGLPFKPMIEPEHKYYYTKDKTEIICSIYLTDNELLKLGEIQKIKATTDYNNSVMFLDVNDKYIIIQMVPSKILEAKKNEKLNFQFYKKEHNNELINAFGH